MDKYEQKRLLQAIKQTMIIIEQEKRLCTELERKYMLSAQKEIELSYKHALKTNIFN